MIFTRDETTSGVGIVVPCQREVLGVDDLFDEALHLWRAEVNNSDESRLWSDWGSVGLAVRPGYSLPADWRAAWLSRFDTQKVAIPLLDQGLLNIPWPSPLSGPPLDVDVLLATANKPSDRLATPFEIADAWIRHGHEEYFLNNVRHGLLTPDDEAIWRRMWQQRPDWLGESQYRDTIETLGHLYPSGIRGLWRMLSRRFVRWLNQFHVRES
jgi:hypothetical protein